VLTISLFNYTDVKISKSDKLKVENSTCEDPVKHCGNHAKCILFKMKDRKETAACSCFQGKIIGLVQFSLRKMTKKVILEDIGAFVCIIVKSRLTDLDRTILQGNDY
jgi:hypothetical protein